MFVVVIFIFLFLVGCSGPDVPVRIEFDVRANGDPIDCDPAEGAGSLTDLRLYLHDIEFIDSDGVGVALTLDEDQRWQSRQVAMLDFENGRGGCLNGTAATNTAITGTLSRKTSHGLRFTIGVPEEFNHANPLTAEAPLGDSAMHWHWASGYKFIRAGGASASGEFAFHLGSNRCEGTIGDIQGCIGNNRPIVEFNGFDPDTQVVVIDVGRWLGANNTIERCMSAPDNVVCRTYFEAVGLDFDTGEAVSSAPIFVVADR